VLRPEDDFIRTEVDQFCSRAASITDKTVLQNLVNYLGRSHAVHQREQSGHRRIGRGRSATSPLS
jgi:hypothetical protein